MDCLEGAAAWEALHGPGAGELDAEGVLGLARAAGYAEGEAQQAARDRAWERLKKDLPP